MSLDPRLLKRLRAAVTLASPGETIAVRSPFTGAVLGEIPAAGPGDVDLAFSRARAAQAGWAALPCSARGRIFLRFHDLLLDRQSEVLDLIQLETGKARRHAFEEILDSAVVARYYGRHSAKHLRPRRRRGALPVFTRTWEIRHPVGVVGFIVPWNYPLNLAVTDAIAALMAGNSGVLRPDPQTSFTALWAVELLREAGLPADVLQIVTGDGPALGEAVAARADYVIFTGSTRTGRIVGRQAAERLAGCSLELGGKNPMLVLADARLDAAVEGAIRGCFAGAGQVCVSIERIYVHRSVFDDFLARFAVRAKGLKLGSALDYSADMGSLASDRQLARVEEHVADALAQGATLVAGGRRRPELGPLFYEPTILTGVLPRMKLYAEETFGPVVAVYPFETEDQAVALANASPYGLSAAIWSRSPRRALRLARRIQAGSVNINEAYSSTWGSTDSPIGGWKQSGLRPRHGVEGLLKYTIPQTIAAQRVATGRRPRRRLLRSPDDLPRPLDEAHPHPRLSAALPQARAFSRLAIDSDRKTIFALFSTIAGFEFRSPTHARGISCSGRADAEPISQPEPRKPRNLRGFSAPRFCIFNHLVPKNRASMRGRDATGSADYRSLTGTTRSAATSRSTCRMPLGQSTSISFAAADAPRPKCTRESLEEA
jgi:acyl-CoA reductase-like NAD-dependent aldehyde dehydrogenase